MKGGTTLWEQFTEEARRSGSNIPGTDGHIMKLRGAIL